MIHSPALHLNHGSDVTRTCSYQVNDMVFKVIHEVPGNSPKAPRHICLGTAQSIAIRLLNQSLCSHIRFAKLPRLHLLHTVNVLDRVERETVNPSQVNIVRWVFLTHYQWTIGPFLHWETHATQYFIEQSYLHTVNIIRDVCTSPHMCNRINHKMKLWCKRLFVVCAMWFCCE